MAVDYEKLRKKAKKRDEEKQKKDAYEYSRSMYEGAKKNRSNVSANTYKLYYDDYIKNTKAYKNEQKKGILLTAFPLPRQEKIINLLKWKKRKSRAHTISLRKSMRH